MENISIALGWIVFLIIITIWSTIWKGIALWKSTKNNQIPWFVFFFLVNTAGILEIIYIYVISRKNKEEITPKM